VLAALPKSAHPGAKKALAEIWGAEDKDHARAAVNAFEAAYGAKFPKAAAKITDDAAQLLAFYDFPAEHWVHLRTTNPRVNFRDGPAPEQGHQRPGLAGRRTGHGVQADRVSSDHWRMVNAPHLVALVRAGATFTNGKLLERPAQDAPEAEPKAA
jgi:Transposase, Mutator family